ncbi:MAG: 5' nucleotidase, NT5C type [Candidatus Methylomirabilis sp.]
MRIGIDLDDVLADSLPHYLRAFNQRFGFKIDLADAAWRMFRRYPQIPHQEINDFFSELIEAGFFASRPLLPGAREAVERLTDDGHHLFIVTGRAPKDEAITRNWLSQVGLTRHLSGLVHKGIEPVWRYKSEAASELLLDLFIEDELAVAIAIAEAEIPVLLYDHPWNQGTLSDNVRRVRSWAEVLTKVAELNGGEGKGKARDDPA